MKVTVLGGGSWGLALSCVLTDNEHDVLVYDADKDIVDTINQKHYCRQLDEPIPDTIHATHDLSVALNHTNILLFVVPTKALRTLIDQIKPLLKDEIFVINAAKGLEPETFLRVSEIIAATLGDFIEGFVALSGPTHAEEVIRRKTTLITSASDQVDHARYAQTLFHNNDYFRVYSSSDLIGVELGGALKNIFALASGLIRGLGFGDNANAALMTRGLVEMKKLYNHFGASHDALFGLSGVGDLIVTCTSIHSRNFQAGYQIGKGGDWNQTIESMTMAVEGIRTCEAAYKLSQQNNLDTPIIDALYDVVFNRIDPKQVHSRLLARDQKAERFV